METRRPLAVKRLARPKRLGADPKHVPVMASRDPAIQMECRHLITFADEVVQPNSSGVLKPAFNSIRHTFNVLQLAVFSLAMVTNLVIYRALVDHIAAAPG